MLKIMDGLKGITHGLLWHVGERTKLRHVCNAIAIKIKYRKKKKFQIKLMPNNQKQNTNDQSAICECVLNAVGQIAQ